MGYNEKAVVKLLKNIKANDLDITKLSNREKRLFELISVIITEKLEPEHKIMMAKMMNMQMPTKRLPKANQTAVITTENKKSAALLFDRVWTPYIKDVPGEILFWGDSGLEIDLWSCIRISDGAPEYITDQAFMEKIVTNAHTLLELILFEIAASSGGENPHRLYSSQNTFVVALIHLISHHLNIKYNLNIKTLFPSKIDYDREYLPGDHRVIYTCLNDIALPDENELRWEQVLELRKDKKSREHYRKLIHWLNKEMVGKSTNFIIDEIGEKLQGYEWALRKHGIKTIRGTVGKILDYKTIIEAAMTFGFVTAANIGIDPILAASGYLIGKTAINITDMYIDYKDLQIGPGSEIAYIYEIKNK